MKTCNLDIWEFEYIKDLEDWDYIAWTDEDALEMYPEYAKLYDKLYMAKKVTNLKTYNLEVTIPAKFPVLVKPRMNLEGMSKDAYIASHADEIQDHQGMIAQELARGNHYSTDLVFLEGEIIDWFTFQAHTNHYGSFRVFKSVKYCNENVCNKIKPLLRGYTGVVCVEYIGDNPIDVHLRPSVQFYDICGGLQEQLPRLIKTGEWDIVNYRKTFSKVYRRFADCRIILTKKFKLPDGVTSVQQCWKKGAYLSEESNDLFSYRYLVINGTSLKAIEKHGEKIIDHIRFIRKD